MTSHEPVTIATVYGTPDAGLSPSQPPQPRRSPGWLAPMLAVLGVGGWWLGLYVGAYVTEIFDFRIGQIASLLAAGGGVLTALLNVPQAKRLPLAVKAVASLASGLVVLALAVPRMPPGYWAMRAEMHKLKPTGWTTIYESRGGNGLCFDECTNITLILEPPADDELHAEELLTGSLTQHGYHRVPDEYADGGRDFERGRFKVRMDYDGGFPASPGYEGSEPGWALHIDAG